jgi:hypothetical protein
MGISECTLNESGDLTVTRCYRGIIVGVMAGCALVAGCSGGQAATGNREVALIALQRVINDENALNRAEGEYSQGTASSCPPGTTLPSKSLSCSNLPHIDSVRAAQLRAAVVTEQTKVASDKAAYLRAKGNLPGLPTAP